MNTDNALCFPRPYTAALLIVAEVLRAVAGSVVKLQLTPRRNFDGESFTIAYDAEVVWSRVGPDGRLGWGTHAGTVELRQHGFHASLFWGHYDLSEVEALEDRATDHRNRLTFNGEDLH